MSAVCPSLLCNIPIVTSLQRALNGRPFRDIRGQTRTAAARRAGEVMSAAQAISGQSLDPQAIRTQTLEEGGKS